MPKRFRIALSLAADLVVIAGAGLLVEGMRQVYVPAAWMLAGAFMLVAGLAAARRLGAR